MRAGQAVAEKARIGHDLHDGIVQTLYAVGLVLETARKTPHDPTRAATLIEQGVTTLNAGIRDVRACIDGLAAERAAGGSFAAVVRGVTEMLGSGATPVSICDSRRRSGSPRRTTPTCSALSAKP
jgi:signal transduction histidine kinase